MRQESVPYDATSNLFRDLSAGQDRPNPLEASWKDRVLRLGEPAATDGWRAISVSLAIVGLITIAGFWIQPIIRGSNLAILYMLSVIFSALRWGRRAAILSAVSGAVALNLFFVPPYRNFAVSDIMYSITLIGLLTVGLVISMLTVAAREDARLARQREAHAAALYSFTNTLASGNELDQVLDAVARHLLAVFRRPIVIFLPDAERLTIHFQSPEIAIDQRESEIASWVFRNGLEAGYGTETFAASAIRYRPLKTGEGIVGVIGFQAGSLGGLLPPDQRELLGIFMNQIALAITRANLASKAKRAEVLQEADKLQKALLNSVSHNLRTPLASVLGVLNTILEDGTRLDIPTRQSLLTTAQDEARRLDWLVQNLLDMTRLEGGAIRVKAELCDVHDVVGAALRQLGEATRNRSIVVSISPDLPLVPMDDVLIVQALVNILDNALKYSPSGTPIEIFAQAHLDELEICVLDSGTGIPEEEVERVFEKFFRGALPGGPKGAGLGLSICKGFVEAHNGRILAKRRAQGGTELTFFLPLEKTSG